MRADVSRARLIYWKMIESQSGTRSLAWRTDGSYCPLDTRRAGLDYSRLMKEQLDAGRGANEIDKQKALHVAHAKIRAIDQGDRER